MEHAAVRLIRARLGDDVDDAAAVRPNSALAPLATTWNSFTASSVMSIAARWPPSCSPKNPLL